MLGCESRAASLASRRKRCLYSSFAARFSASREDALRADAASDRGITPEAIALVTCERSVRAWLAAPQESPRRNEAATASLSPASWIAVVRRIEASRLVVPPQAARSRQA